MSADARPYSHPDAPVRHSYPLAIDRVGFSTALSLTMRTLPYAMARFGILLAFSIATITWFVVTLGGAALLGRVVSPWIGVGWFVVGLGVYGWVWWFVVRYMLYLIQAGHVAVLTELVTVGRIGAGSEGMFAYGKRVVTERFGQANALFALDLIVKGIVHTFSRTLDWIAGAISVAGLRAVVGIGNAIVRAATTYIGETLFSYNLARGDDNPWRSSKDGLIYYAQNSTDILKTAMWVVVLDKVLTVLLWIVMLAPALVLLTVLPSTAVPGGVVALVIAALLASNVRQAFLKPMFLVMVMTRFHVAVRNQAINLEWDARLSQISSQFRGLTGRVAAGWQPESVR
jgi:hypothetical protein